MHMRRNNYGEEVRSGSWCHGDHRWASGSPGTNMLTARPVPPGCTAHSSTVIAELPDTSNVKATPAAAVPGCPPPTHTVRSPGSIVCAKSGSRSTEWSSGSRRNARVCCLLDVVSVTRLNVTSWCLAVGTVLLWIAT